MLVAASKYSSARARVSRTTQPKARASKPTLARAAFDVLVPAAKAMNPTEFYAWYHKELKDGGGLAEYLRKEKALTPARYRQLARRMHGFQQNNKSDVRRVADIPLRDYFRWMKEDPDFFADDKNLKSLRRDNKDVCVYL